LALRTRMALVPSAVHTRRVASGDHAGNETLVPGPPGASSATPVPSGRMVRSEPSKSMTASRPGSPAVEPRIVVVGGVGAGAAVLPGGAVVVVVVLDDGAAVVVVVGPGRAVVVVVVAVEVIRS
jgi:hypothetical protein